MIWLTWRQQRLEALLATIALALVAALLVPVGLHMASVYSHTGVSSCLAHRSGDAAGCGNAISSFDHRFEHLGGLLPWLNLVPALIGVLLAAPFVLELEQGTFRLAWTQSITPRRWLAVKLSLITLAGAAAALALTALTTWYRQPLDHVQGRMGTDVFDFEGIVPVAYTLLAIALVLALGAFTRRTVPAVGGALAAFLALRLSFQTWIRPHYAKPIKSVWRPGQPGPRGIDTAWSIHSGLSDRLGHPLGDAARVCIAGLRQGGCLPSPRVFNYAVYQPASRFWRFQLIEAGIFIGFALILGAVAVWWIRGRPA